jgi:hypothetical protein
MSKLTLVPKVAAQGILGVVIFVVWITVYLFFIGAFITGGLYIYSHVTDRFHHSQSSVSLQQYVSTQGGFEISFPYGVPNTKNSKLSSQEVNIPYTSYYTESNNNNIQYIVSEYNFPSTQLEVTKKTLLQDEVNEYAQSQKSSITSSSFTTFQGNSALQAQLGNTSDISVNEGYYLSFFNKQNFFIIQTWGTSKGNYQAFINSFKFTQ